MEETLFQPITVGKLNLSSRIAMAPLTRFRCDDSHVPLPFAKTYYGQRASTPGTLLITEATTVSQLGAGYDNVPGIWNDAQVQGWKPIVEEVHAKGCYVYCQLWFLGRVATPEVQARHGLKIVSSSAKAVDEKHPVPHALTEEEIQGCIRDFANAATNAMRAGFDGVEVHSANGYLCHQFLEDTCNSRTDRWGGSIENRSRFTLEVTKAVIDAVGDSERVGVRLSPISTFQGMGMEDPIPQFTHVIRGLKKLSIAYLHLVQPRISGSPATGVYEDVGELDFALAAWGRDKPVILAGGFDAEKAKTAIKEYQKFQVLIAFGRYYISTPDLVFRVQNGIPLNPYNRKTFYKKFTEEGYTDYEFSKEFLARI